MDKNHQGLSEFRLPNLIELKKKIDVDIPIKRAIIGLRRNVFGLKR